MYKVKRKFSFIFAFSLFILLTTLNFSHATITIPSGTNLGYSNGTALAMTQTLAFNNAQRVSGVWSFDPAYTYTGALSKVTDTILVGDLATINLAVNRDSVAFSNYQVNITKDGELFKTNLGSTSFTDTEPNPQGHTYLITGIYDTELGISDTAVASTLDVVWANPGGISVGPVATPTPTASANPTVSPEITIPTEQPLPSNLAVFAVIALIAVGAGLTLNSYTQKNPRFKRREGLQTAHLKRRNGLPHLRKKKRRKSYFN